MSLDANKDQNAPKEAPRLPVIPAVQIVQPDSSTKTKEMQTNSNQNEIRPNNILPKIETESGLYSTSTTPINESENSKIDSSSNNISNIIQKANHLNEPEDETTTKSASSNVPILSVEFLMSPNTKSSSPRTNSIKHFNHNPIIIHQASRNQTDNVHTSTKISTNSISTTMNSPQPIKRPPQPPIPMIQIPQMPPQPPTSSNIINNNQPQVLINQEPTNYMAPQNIQYTVSPSQFSHSRLSPNISYQPQYSIPSPKTAGIYQMYPYTTPYYSYVQPPVSPTIQNQVTTNIPQIPVNGPIIHPISTISPQTITTMPQIQPLTQLPQISHINQISTVQNVSIPPSNQIESSTSGIRIVPPPSPQILPINSNSNIIPITDRNPPREIPIKPLNQPLPQPIVTLHPLPAPVVTKPKPESSSDMKPPTPTYYTDKDSGEYGVRCVCGEGHIDCMLVQCDMCEFWLHGLCVNVARETKDEQYFCPFCLQRKIRCKCKENMKYSEPIIQCTKCRYWVHKSCEDLEFGINPENFVCSFCGETTYDIPEVTFSDEDEEYDHEVVIDGNKRQEILNIIPDGLLKNMIIDDLNNSIVSFKQLIPKYFHEFAPLLFQPSNEFWKVIVESFSILFDAERTTIMSAFDSLATHLLYKPIRNVRTNGRLTKTFANSESIADVIKKSDTWPRLEKQQTPVKIYMKDGHVYTPIPLDDGAFISELPGFLMHSDEVRAENGIPLNCLTVTNHDVILDTDGTTFTFAPYIRRSFHFNCMVKLIRIKGEPRVGLFATMMRRVPFEEKTRRGPAIQADCELRLPFDGDIPFPTKKIEWKEKKQRGPGRSLSRQHSEGNDDENSNKIVTRSAERKNSRTKSFDKNASIQTSSQGRKSLSRSTSNSNLDQMNLTLLNSFYDSTVPPMPFILLEDQDAVDRYNQQQEIRSRTRSSRAGRHRNNE